MQGCLPARYRLLDLLFVLWGTVAFLVDLSSDVWSGVRYYQAGDKRCAVLYIGFFLLSSSVLQILSWGWFWVDQQDRSSEDVQENATGTAVQICGDPDVSKTSNGETKHRSIGTETPGDVRQVTVLSQDVSVVDAVPAADVCDPKVVQSLLPSVPGSGAPATPEKRSALCCSWRECSDDEFIYKRFWTSRIMLWPSCFTLLHILQLGYPLRCIHSLEVGIAAYRNPEDDLFKDYAYFLTHDMSLMRLVETFLENTPQLILVLYIIIQREAIQTFQCFSISISFICISWAILDYHQSLRLFLQGKQKLSIWSSAIYYLWNFFLISSRILCITLFAITFHCWIILHFFLLWLAFFLWASLLETTFMKHKFLEIVYRSTVAIILYFSWFNIADGRTIYRCIVYHVFIVIDCVILLVSWVKFKFPSILDGHEIQIIVTNMAFFAVGLLLRVLYYKYLHPNVHRKTKEYFDVPDGIPRAGTNKKLLSAGKLKQQISVRMQYLASQVY